MDYNVAVSCIKPTPLPSTCNAPTFPPLKTLSSTKADEDNTKRGFFFDNRIFAVELGKLPVCTITLHYKGARK